MKPERDLLKSFGTTDAQFEVKPRLDTNYY